MSLSSFRLYLVRHGDTAWSEMHRHTGLTDVELSEQGENQARALGVYLHDVVFTKAYTSPLIRAVKTCELAGFSKESEWDNDLVEWDYGDYEGLTTTAIRQAHPAWNVFTHPCPNGETADDVGQRADRFIQKVRSIPGNVIAFSSGHIIRVITARWLSLEPQAGRFFLASTAAISILGYEHDLNEPVVCLWNE